MYQLDYDVINVDWTEIGTFEEERFFNADEKMLFCRKFWPSS